jgi:hypothetical protein
LKDDDLIAVLIQKQTSDRRLFKIHACAALGWFAFFFIKSMFLSSFIWYHLPNRHWIINDITTWVTIILGLTFIVHLFFYVKSMHWTFDKLGRKAIQLASELDSKQIAVEKPMAQ